jgi:hypothetical protein
LLPILALSLAVVFFILLRQGLLDELPQRLGRAIRSGRRRSSRSSPDEERRLEVFKDFIEGDSNTEQ